jgi:hypothetical protein
MSRTPKRSRRRGGPRSVLGVSARDAQAALWLTRRLWRPLAHEVFVARTWIAPRRGRSEFRIAAPVRRRPTRH